MEVEIQEQWQSDKSHLKPYYAQLDHADHLTKLMLLPSRILLEVTELSSTKYRLGSRYSMSYTEFMQINTKTRPLNEDHPPR